MTLVVGAGSEAIALRAPGVHEHLGRGRVVQSVLKPLGFSV